MDVIFSPLSSAQLNTILYTKINIPKSKPTTQFKRHPFYLPRISSHLISNNAVNAKLVDIHHVFDKMPMRDTFAWNKLIQTHINNGDPEQALLVYDKMLVLGVRPDRHTIPRVLSASRNLNALVVGKQVHGQSLKFGISCDRYVFTALLELYGRLDTVGTARWLFDKSPSELKSSAIVWTVLAKLYVLENKPRLAIDLFKVMVESKAADMDSVAIAVGIGASGELKLLKEGKQFHRISRERGLEFDVLVSNSLMKMYLDCGSLDDARQVFDNLPTKDVISWTEMLRGYVKKGGFNEGLKLFRNMALIEGLRPDPLAISSILPACARVTGHKNGREMHCYLLRNGIVLNVMLLNAVIDMYVKSCNLDYASTIFSKMSYKDAISWTVMIMGYSLHGYGDIGIKKFREMEKNACLEIDQTLYVAVLYACCTANMVDDGKFYFNKIRSPKVAHCELLVALLARSGLFEEARSFIEKINISREIDVLRALLDGCRIRKNISMGKRITEQLLDLEPLNADHYVMLSNWYAHSQWRTYI